MIKYGCPECDEKIDLRQQLGQQYKTKSQDYIYVWRYSSSVVESSSNILSNNTSLGISSSFI